ncbi:MAG: DUF1294 domain-containing protein [Methanoregula sp.]|jgi:uncharacterized membrane protein YsdA (DUF1294 family)|uniref:DUF1294 domain-containing protein n=1 Tax=Methanoregula sp. TaxID=2052170 RepID=UPI003C19D9D0
MRRSPGNLAPANNRELIKIDGILVLIVLYLCMNIVAAWAFAWDKRKAKNNSWRMSEGTLLVLAFMGPFGAFGAMRLFRHKTRKMKFYLVPLFLVLHCAVFAFILITYR